MKRIIKTVNSFFNYIKGVFQELKLVEFPSKKDTLKLTNTVISIAIIYSILLLGLDTIFTLFRNYLTNI